MEHTAIRILGISGSLREKSANSRLLTAFAELLPARATYETYDGLAELPHFNPDLDGDEQWRSEAVQNWRARLGSVDAVVICTPEYARGLPGSLKNALDWIVSSGEFVDKPTAAISASPHPEGGAITLQSLTGTLRMMSANLPDERTLPIPGITLKFAADGRLKDEAVASDLQKLADSLVRDVRSREAK